MTKLIPYEEALETVLSSVTALTAEQVDFVSCLNRVLAEDVFSDIELPPFRKSAMDGYACRKEDIGKAMILIETIAAGKTPEKNIGKGQCSKIMTGAMVPEGADTVLKIEDTLVNEEGKVIFTGESTRANIIEKGEDVRAGDRVLVRGTIIRPQHIAVLATVGCIAPLVSRQVKIGIISTGDEIIEPGEKPALSQIRNSNGYQLIAQSYKSGALPGYYGIAGDSRMESLGIIENALAENDVLLITGGVSMGDFDFIPGVLESLNVQILFQTIAVQPGKPTVFGLLEEKRIFGLPGNPVSSFNIFELLVKPMIYKMMGANPCPKMLSLPMGKEYKREKSGRMSWIPVMINTKGEVIPVEYHGSAHINALSGADGIIGIPVGTTILQKGEKVNVRQI